MKILIGITGSISAYKMYDVVRGLVKEGHEVKVVLTKGALKLIRHELFLHLGAKAVFTDQDDFNLEKSKEGILHIELARWCDRLIIAPLSANTLAAMAAGHAQDLLQSVVLALGPNRPFIVYPAMNTQMYKNPIVQDNFKRLKLYKNLRVHSPASGLLACGEVGEGKLPNVEEIIATIPTHQINQAKRHVLISTGASISPLDPVRYLTNPSSGKTGYELAKYFLAKGDKVTIVAGQYALKELEYLNELPQYQLIRGTTTSQMKEIITKLFQQCDLYISSAAFCDLEFNSQDGKLKKSQLSGQLNFNNAPDILASLLEIKKHQKIIGFAAETSLTEENLLEKWNRKPVDLLIGNIVSNGLNNQKQQGFGTDHGHYKILSQGKTIEELSLTKSQLAHYINEWDQKH